MSYSYVKTVFPDFKYSNVYDMKLYENLNESQQSNNRLFEPVDLNNIHTFSPVLQQPQQPQQPQQLQQQKEEQKERKQEYRMETFQNNQKFYNLPLPKTNIPDNNNRFREEFDENKNNHLEYTKHILECPSCKELLMKQFNIENERIRNEEIMELISYLIFGLFILLMIDTYNKK